MSVNLTQLQLESMHSKMLLWFANPLSAKTNQWSIRIEVMSFLIALIGQC